MIKLTDRERTLKTLRHEPIDCIVWQPRIYYWFYGNRLQNRLPDGYFDRSMLDEFFRLIDAFIDSPKIYEQYLMPYYQKRVEQIHKTKKLCHIHMDGALKPLLPLLSHVDFDGIEAVTPLPQGDVTLEEIKEALGNIILLDGMPAIYFLPEYPEEELFAFTEKILKMFAPNIILGISDELPPTGDINRVKLVADIVKDFKWA